MAWTIAGTCLSGRACGQFATGRIDAEDANEIGTEIWYEQEFASGILEDCVRVRCILPGAHGAGLGHGELFFLQHLGARAQGQLVSRNGRGVATHELDRTLDIKGNHLLFGHRYETRTVNAAV